MLGMGVLVMLGMLGMLGAHRHCIAWRTNTLVICHHWCWQTAKLWQQAMNVLRETAAAAVQLLFHQSQLLIKCCC